MSLGENKISIVADIIIWYLRFLVLSVILNIFKQLFFTASQVTNSYKRKKLNNRSPYETFSFYYGEDILKKLGCKPVAAENIILKPKLLKK